MATKKNDDDDDLSLGAKEKARTKWTPALITTTVGITAMSISLLIGVALHVLISKRQSSSSASSSSSSLAHLMWAPSVVWGAGLVCVIVGTCILPQRRRDLWRVSCAVTGLLFILTWGLLTNLGGRAAASGAATLLLAAGTVLLLSALTLYVREREASTALLGVTSLVLGAAVAHAALTSGARQQRFTAILIVALIAGLFISVVGKFAFAANVQQTTTSTTQEPATTTSTNK